MKTHSITWQHGGENIVTSWNKQRQLKTLIIKWQREIRTRNNNLNIYSTCKHKGRTAAAVTLVSYVLCVYICVYILYIWLCCQVMLLQTCRPFTSSQSFLRVLFSVSWWKHLCTEFKVHRKFSSRLLPWICQISNMCWHLLENCAGYGCCCNHSRSVGTVRRRGNGLDPEQRKIWNNRLKSLKIRLMNCIFINWECD